jgi:hypothetical protein
MVELIDASGYRIYRAYFTALDSEGETLQGDDMPRLCEEAGDWRFLHRRHIVVSSAPFDIRSASCGGSAKVAFICSAPIGCFGFGSTGSGRGS